MTWNEPALSGTKASPRCGKACPRCGKAFDCKVDDLKHCDCVAVKVSLPVLKTLQKQYSDCLCADCLRDLAGDAELKAAPVGA